MAHDIVRQFAGEPPEQTTEMVAAHLRMLWAPTMIQALVAEADRGTELDPVVARVVDMLR